MPLKGFIESKDAENIKLTTGNAKLYHTSKDSSENSEIINGVNTDAYYFSIEGENSQFYELDKSTLPKVVSKILPRPVNIEFIIPPKEYDGDMSIDLSTVAYRFKPTGSEDSGLVLGNQAHDNHGLSFEDIRIDKYDYSEGTSVITSQMHDTIRVMDEPGYKKQFWSFDTDYEKDYPELVYTLRGDEPDRHRYILEDKWMPYNIDKLNFNLYSQSRSRRSNDRNFIETHDEDLSIITSVKQSTTRYINENPIALTVEPNSILTFESSVDSNVYIFGGNLINNAELSVDTGSDIIPNELGHFVSTDDLPEVGRYYYMTYNGQRVTAEVFAMAMCRLEYVSDLSYGNAVLGIRGAGPDSASCPLRLGILKGNALYTLCSSGSVFSLIVVPEKFLSGELVVWKVNDTIDFKWDTIITHKTGVLSSYTAFKSDKITVKAGAPFQYKNGNDAIIHVAARPHVKLTYTPGVLYFSDASGYLRLNQEEASHDKFTTFRKDVARSDFLDLVTQVSSITFPENVKFDEVTEMQISDPTLSGNAAANYKVNKIYGVSKILPRRVTVTVAAINKVFDGTCSMPAALSISNVVEGDEVLPNPEYFILEAPFSRPDWWRTILIENASVPPLIGKDAYKYQLDKVEQNRIAEIYPLPAKIRGGEFIVHVNNTSNDQYINDDIHVTLTNCLVDYNNNELSYVDAHVNPDQSLSVVRVVGADLSLDSIVKQLKILLSPTLGTRVQIGNIVAYDGDQITLIHDNAGLIGKDANSIMIEDGTTTYTVRIRHCN